MQRSFNVYFYHARTLIYIDTLPPLLLLAWPLSIWASSSGPAAQNGSTAKNQKKGDGKIAISRKTRRIFFNIQSVSVRNTPSARHGVSVRNTHVDTVTHYFISLQILLLKSTGSSTGMPSMSIAWSYRSRE